MLGLEQQELESLRRQHDVKSSELADTQRRLLEERAELDRMTSESQRREAELVRIKQVEKKVPCAAQTFVLKCCLPYIWRNPFSCHELC